MVYFKKTYQLIMKKIYQFNKKLLFSFIVLILSQQLNATIIYVPAEQPTIQEGINSANNGDTVLVAPGTYTENINMNGKNIVVASYFLTTQNENYITQTVIDGGSPIESVNASVVTFENNEDSTAILCGFSITNGSGNYMQPYEDTPDFWVYAGGGIFCANANPQFKNLKIYQNSVSDWGGGIFLTETNSYFENLTISNNSSHVGGGIMNWINANTIFKNIEINNNSANNGGGIEIIESSPLLTNLNIYENHAASVCGGCYIADANPVIENSIISKNSSDLLAGGILFWNFGGENNCPTLINVLITDNNAEYGAGIYYEGIANTKLINVTIANNSASVESGGIYCYSTFLINSIIWGNTPDQIDYFGPQDSVIIMYSAISEDWAGEGNINENPLFVDENNYDYHLSDVSPCISAGIMTPDIPETDIEGNPRPNPIGSNPDMGAYENPNGTTSIFNINNKNLIKISPNPSNGVIILEINNFIADKILIEITGVNGQIVYNKTFNTINKIEQIDLSQNAKGLYFVRVKTKDFEKVGKLIIK